MAEGHLEKYLINRCKDAGVYQRKVKCAGRRGFPDRLLAGDGRVILIELKHDGGTGVLSVLQEREIARLKAAGVDVRVIDNKREIDDAIRDIIK